MNSISEKEKRKTENSQEKDPELSDDLDESDSESEALNFEINEHVDCRDSVNKWLNAEIIALRNNEIRVHYTGWSNKYDEWIEKDSERILKQCKLIRGLWVCMSFIGTKGKKFRLNNRIDANDENGKWLEARVVDIKPNQVLVHFYNFSSKFDCWFDKNSDRIAEVGTYSKAFGGGNGKNPKGNQPSQTSDKDNTQQHSTVVNPHKYAQELYKIGLVIRQIGDDGNCLFRAISDQIYNTEKYHSEIRAYCMKYIEIEADYFRNFIEGGNSLEKFYLYLESKKKDGIWGDDVEIQALSEIYNRPIEIYVYSSKPIRTFHESTFYENEPIRLSYHGRSHYNSIRKNETKEKFVKEKFGELEENSLKIAKLRVENSKLPNSLKEVDKCLILSRNEFEIRNIRELEMALEESLKLTDKANEMQEIEAQMLDLVSKEENQEELEKILLQEAIKASLGENKENKEKLQIPEAVMKVVQEGFPLELAMQAYNFVGDDVAMMIQYISEIMLS